MHCSLIFLCIQAQKFVYFTSKGTLKIPWQCSPVFSHDVPKYNISSTTSRSFPLPGTQYCTFHLPALLAPVRNSQESAFLVLYH